MKIAPKIAVTLAALLAVTAASAQNMPKQLRDRLVEIGPNYGQVDTPKMFAPLVAAAPKDGGKVTRDITYGTHARHRLDVWQPSGKSNAPIIVYVHGGGYISGTKEIYDNIPAYFQRHGMLAINMEYRLAPEAPWPAGAQDVAAVVAWIKKSAAKYGGDPNRLYLMGHSAGATHVATYVFDRRFQPRDGSGVTAVVLSSGRYNVTDEPDDPSFNSVRAYFGSDPKTYPSRSIINHVPSSRIGVMLTATEFDQQNLAATTGDMYKALCERDGGQCPRFVQTKYHNHISEMHHINSADDYLGQEILEFLGMTDAPPWPTAK